MHNPIMEQLENSRLKVLRAATEHLNFHKAAARLSLTHPAATSPIKALESDLGVRLFDCAGGKVSLRRRGSILLTYANEVSAMVSEASHNSVWPPLGRYPRVDNVIDKRGGRRDVP